MQKITNFFKYNNAFVIILGALFLAAGSSFASETVRDAVIGQTIEEMSGMDNSALLSASLDSLKQEMSIADVSEDEESYYVVYSFSTFDIKDNSWQNQTKNQILKVPKDALNGGKDLGLYIQSELAQVMDGHLAYLKDAQEKEQKKGITKIVKTTKYTGLKGLVLNSETKELDGYEPVIKKEERIEPPYVAPAAVVSAVPAVSVSSSSSTISSSSSSVSGGSGGAQASSESSSSSTAESSSSSVSVSSGESSSSSSVASSESSSISSVSQSSQSSDASSQASSSSSSESVSSSSSSEQAVSNSSSSTSTSVASSSQSSESSSSAESSSS